jgi:hypothetical protein
MTTVNGTVWVCVTANVTNVEIQQAAPCEAWFVGHEYEAAKEEIFTELS